LKLFVFTISFHGPCLLFCSLFLFLISLSFNNEFSFCLYVWRTRWNVWLNQSTFTSACRSPSQIAGLAPVIGGVRPNTYEIPRVFQAKPSGNFPYVRYYVLQSSFDKEGNLLRRLHLCIGKARGPLPDAIGWPFGLLTLTRAVGPRQQPFLLSTSTQEKPNLLRDPELDNEPLGQWLPA